MGGNARCSGGTGGKVGPKLKKKTIIFPRKSGAFVPILTWKVLSPPFTHT